MKTLRYISNAFRFLRSPNTNEDASTNKMAKVELISGKFGFNLKRPPTSGKTPTSLLGLMYSEENNTLFI